MSAVNTEPVYRLDIQYGVKVLRPMFRPMPDETDYLEVTYRDVTDAKSVRPNAGPREMVLRRG